MSTRTNILWIAVLLAVLATVLARCARLSDKEQLDICTQNLATVASAVEAYFRDDEGGATFFPPRLEDIVPRYLPAIPVCPTNGQPYRYQRYDDIAGGADYDLRCPGHHKGYAEGFPIYTYQDGLVKGPDQPHFRYKYPTEESFKPPGWLIEQGGWKPSPPAVPAWIEQGGSPGKDAEPKEDRSPTLPATAD